MTLFSILGWAVVTLSSAFMRLNPDYEAPLENQMLMGALVETLDTEGYWVKVRAEDYTGWVTDLSLHELTDEEKDAWLASPKWICTAEYTRIREEPGKDSAPICDFTMGDLVRQTGETCPSGRWTKVQLPDGRFGWVPSTAVTDFAMRTAALSPNAKDILSLARSFAGTPYMWGGNSIKHFDCSGLVKFCYYMNGLILPRNASQQIKCGRNVFKEEWQPGDLLFFGSAKPFRVTHVALYAGDGVIVHSSKKVKIETLEVYGREPIGAVRILGYESNGVKFLKDDPYYFKKDGK
ncbi:MAG: C40 family peptidase [Bacteroidales bacterium]|nr:C40 family peptidase [Bacteroidales bacterium]